MTNGGYGSPEPYAELFSEQEPLPNLMDATARGGHQDYDAIATKEHARRLAELEDRFFAAAVPSGGGGSGSGAADGRKPGKKTRRISDRTVSTGDGGAPGNAAGDSVVIGRRSIGDTTVGGFSGAQFGRQSDRVGVEEWRARFLHVRVTGAHVGPGGAAAAQNREDALPRAQPPARLKRKEGGARAGRRVDHGAGTGGGEGRRAGAPKPPRAGHSGHSGHAGHADGASARAPLEVEGSPAATISMDLEQAEVLARHGEYEEMIAFELSAPPAEVHPACAQAGPGREARRGLPPVTPERCIREEILSLLFDKLWMDCVQGPVGEASVALHRAEGASGAAGAAGASGHAHHHDDGAGAGGGWGRGAETVTDGSESTSVAARRQRSLGGWNTNGASGGSSARSFATHAAFPSHRLATLGRNAPGDPSSMQGLGVGLDLEIISGGNLRGSGPRGGAAAITGQHGPHSSSMSNVFASSSSPSSSSSSSPSAAAGGDPGSYAAAGSGDDRHPAATAAPSAAGSFSSAAGPYSAASASNAGGGAGGTGAIAPVPRKGLTGVRTSSSSAAAAAATTTTATTTTAAAGATAATTVTTVTTAASATTATRRRPPPVLGPVRRAIGDDGPEELVGSSIAEVPAAPRVRVPQKRVQTAQPSTRSSSTSSSVSHHGKATAQVSRHRRTGSQNTRTGGSSALQGPALSSHHPKHSAAHRSGHDPQLESVPETTMASGAPVRSVPSTSVLSLSAKQPLSAVGVSAVTSNPDVNSGHPTDTILGPPFAYGKRVATSVPSQRRGRRH